MANIFDNGSVQQYMSKFFTDVLRNLQDGHILEGSAAAVLLAFLRARVADLLMDCARQLPRGVRPSRRPLSVAGGLARALDCTAWHGHRLSVIAFCFADPWVT